MSSIRKFQQIGSVLVMVSGVVLCGSKPYGPPQWRDNIARCGDVYKQFVRNAEQLPELSDPQHKDFILRIQNNKRAFEMAQQKLLAGTWKIEDIKTYHSCVVTGLATLAPILYTRGVGFTFTTITFLGDYYPERIQDDAFLNTIYQHICTEPSSIPCAIENNAQPIYGWHVFFHGYNLLREALELEQMTRRDAQDGSLDREFEQVLERYEALRGEPSENETWFSLSLSLQYLATALSADAADDVQEVIRCRLNELRSCQGQIGSRVHALLDILER